MTLIIAADAFKGGVTKTTNTIHLAARLAREGKRVVVIDADMQANASRALGVEPDDGFYQLILGGKNPSEVVRFVPLEFTNLPDHELYVVTGGLLTTELKKNKQTKPMINSLLRLFDGWADVLLVDTSPGFDDIHAGVFTVSDYMLLPTLCELDSIESLDQTFDLLYASALDGETVAQVLGIVPSRFNSKIGAHLNNYTMLQAMYRRKHRLFDPVLESNAFMDARGRCRSIYAHLETIRADKGRRYNAKHAEKAIKNFDDALADHVVKLVNEQAVAVP
jgi:chromosome partitioning protein